MTQLIPRFPAEWEPQSAVQLTLPHAGTDWAYMLDEVMPCFIEIIETIANYQLVLVICQDSVATLNLFKPELRHNIRCHQVPSNDTWARDHGGITVIEENEQATVLDFSFNGWGLKFAADQDNLITQRLHAQGAFQAGHRYTGLVLEGGGIESDGQGTLLTTAECLLSLNRNPHLSKADIEFRLHLLLGTDHILWLHHGYLAGDDTDSHIDTLARLCDANTIAYVRCDDATDEHYDALQKMEQEVLALRTRDGQPFRCVPLPWPAACHDDEGHRLPATYANFLIINGAVLVPTYGLSQDDEALRIIGELFPDRDTIGINCRALIEQHGSLHCVTMQYPAGVVA